MSNRDRYKVLVLGSSHTYYGVNPDYIAMPAFNAANVSQDLKYDHYILDKGVKTLSDLEFVVVPLSMFSLYSELDTGVESWRKYNYRHWFNYNKYPTTELFNIKTHSVFLASPNKLGMIERLFQYYRWGNFEKTWSRGGWGTEYSRVSSEKTLLESGKSAALRHQIATEINDHNISYLDEIAAICNKKNVKLLIVTMPAYATYREHLNGGRIKTIIAIATGLAASSNKIRYVNSLEDAIFVKSDFHDADHLNHEGAKKFSRIISRFIEEWKSSEEIGEHNNHHNK